MSRLVPTPQHAGEVCRVAPRRPASTTPRTESAAPSAIPPAPAHLRVSFHGKLSPAVVAWGVDIQEKIGQEP